MGKTDADKGEIMLEVKGFRGLRFVAEHAGNLDFAVTPPYDVISPEDRALLVSKSDYSMAHLILPQDRPGMDRYQAAATDLDAWLAKGVLAQDDTESLYLLEQTYREPGGDCVRVRRGFLGVSRLPEPGERIVMGHERTFSNVVDDRYHLTASTRANLGPVFVIYDDGGPLPAALNIPADSAPDLDATTIDGVQQRVWRVPADPAVTDFFNDKLLYIADGHHRFRTACAYRDHMRAAENPDGPRAYDYVLMGFVPLSDPGLLVYPTHRLMTAPEGFAPEAFLRALAPWFECTPAGADMEQTLAAETTCAFGLVLPQGARYIIRLRDEIDRAEFLGDDHGPAWRDLDVAILHRGIVERIMGLGDYGEFRYERNAADVETAVESGQCGIGFILRATTPAQIRACAEAGESMPHKSTYFFPKLPTGAVIHRLV